MVARRFAVKWAVLAAIMATSTMGVAQIELPPPPKAVPPPVVPKERDPVELRHQEHLKDQDERREEVKQDVTQKIEKKQVEKAKQEDAAPRPMNAFVEFNLVYPKFVTTGKRKKYNGDFATHIHGWSRLSYAKSSNDVQTWIGLRLAPFSGSGIQKDYAGRFSLTYFGPGIGFGRIEDRPGNATDADEPHRKGWLVSAGVSAVSRLAPRDVLVDHGATDFQSTAWSADGPGVWAEFRWMRTFHNALSINILGGAQLGEGKNILYSGVGIAGWL